MALTTKPNPKYRAIAAMALNRVIGDGTKLPWHLPEEFKWFKQKTTGHILLMGRKTFESIGRALPNRTTIVLTRSRPQVPGAEVISSIEQMPAIAERTPEKLVFVCGGGEIYRQLLPICSELFLTVLKREVPGTVLFPDFEHQFRLAEEIQKTPEFDILRYANRDI
jgi:dihydrofolate reductase